jgi:hypothetical protein
MDTLLTSEGPVGIKEPMRKGRTSGDADWPSLSATPRACELLFSLSEFHRMLGTV